MQQPNPIEGTLDRMWKLDRLNMVAVDCKVIFFLQFTVERLNCGSIELL